MAIPTAMKTISALIYLIGCLAMIIGGVAVVMVELVTIAQVYGPGFGLASLVVTIIACHHYRNIISLPFVAWTALWNSVDARIG